MKLLTAEEMRRLDAATIQGGHASGEQLMERAGAGVVEALERHYGPTLACRVLVLCGPGNNGGDGFVAARHLKARGAAVRVALLGESERVHGEARVHLDRLRAAGLPVAPLASTEALHRLIAEAGEWDFALDALLGTGARGELEGLIAEAAQALRELDDAGTRIVAVDLPTGVSADTGEIARRAVRADLTVTFGAPKRGHFLYPGRAFVGALEVVDIGLLDAVPGGEPCPVELATAEAMAMLLPQRDPRAHKLSVGHVLLVGGSAGLTGAVTLAARAAMRAGAGYVQAAVPASLHDVFAGKLTEEMTLPSPETPQRALALAAVAPLLERAAGADAVALGPGLSRQPEAAELARRLVRECPRPMVVDADALNALEGATAAFEQAAAPRVVTPHLGEMHRLTGEDATALEARRIDAAREWAMRWRVVVLLKGAPTVVAAPDGQATVNPTGNPGMATAGMGDVLTGAIAALLAQGLTPYDAARLAAYAHGAAGDRAAAARGPLGLIASDVVEAFPHALQELSRLRALGPDPRGGAAGFAPHRPE